MKPFDYRISAEFLDGFTKEEPGTYCAIIEAIAGGASRANEIATKTEEKHGMFCFQSLDLRKLCKKKQKNLTTLY